MILPGSQIFNLILLIFGMLCWGVWANTFRMTSKWRFELYYFDFAIGAGLAALLIGFTFGSQGWDGFSMIDDLRLAGRRQEAYALGAGMAFNLGNMLIVGALSIAGVTVSYLIGLNLMLTTGMVITYFTSPSGNGTLLAVGAVLALASAGMLAVSSRLHSLARLVVLMREGKTKTTRKVVSIKGLLLAIFGGIVAAAYYPLVNMAREGENGLGPYALGLFFAIGVVFSTALYNLFFLNLPVQGEPLELSAYFKGKAKSHWLGLLGGALWYCGLISTLILARAEGKNILPTFSIRLIMLGAVAVGTLIGLFRWKEFEGATGNVKTYLTVALALFAFGMLGLSLSSGFSTGG